MYNAPSVTYPVGRCAVHGVVLSVLGSLGLLALALLLWHGAWALDRAACVGGALWILWSAWALRAWWRSPTGQLQWAARAASATALPGARTGGWLWQGRGESPTELSRVEWAMDAQRVVLLRLHPRGQRPCWIWLAARNGPDRWDDLRRALSAHA